MKKRQIIGMAYLFSLFVSANLYPQAPSTPSLISPPDGATDVSVRPTLVWSTADSGCTDSNCTYILYYERLSDGHAWWEEIENSYLEIGVLDVEQTYRWQVRAKNQYGVSDFTPFWSFTTGPLGTPQLLSPPADATGVSITPTLSWSEAQNAHLYAVYVYDLTSAAQIVWSGVNLNVTSVIAGPLEYNTLYGWKVWAYNADAYTKSGEWMFTTMEIGGGIIAYFTASPTSGPAPLTVQFTDQSTGDITNHLWDFGDENTSMHKNPSHVYQNIGTYTVRLTVTGPAGSDSKTRSDYITVSSVTAPVADFTASPTSGPAPLTVQFTDVSAGTISGRNWDFGDGSTSTDADPSHTFNYDGRYTVSLAVTGPGGSNTKTCTDFITVSDNMLLNGNFSDGTDNWPLWIDMSSASASCAVQDGEYVVSITDGSSDSYNVILVQTGLLMENGSTYDVSYDAYADASRQIIPYVAMRSSPWTLYGGYQTVTLFTMKLNYTYSFTMNHATDADARIAFDVGASNTDVRFDNMVLTKRRPSNMLFNGEFTHGTPGWVCYVTSPAVANVSVQHGEYVASITHGGNYSWGVQLNQLFVLLEKGCTYHVTFDAYAASPRQIIPYTSKASPPWTVYSGHEAVDLSTTKQTYAYSFTMNDATDSDGRVSFDLGQSTADVYLDNVMITKETTSVEEQEEITPVPETFVLHQNYPNPFNPCTKIRYEIGKITQIVLNVYNLQGRIIRNLDNDLKHAGIYSITWDGCDDLGRQVPTGVYLIVLKTQGRTHVRKALLVR